LTGDETLAKATEIRRRVGDHISLDDILEILLKNHGNVEDAVQELSGENGRDAPCPSTPKPDGPVEFNAVDFVNRCGLPKDKPNNQYWYHLVSYVHHFGNSSDGGHYLADVCEDGSWKRFDDSNVSDPGPAPQRSGQIEKSGYLFVYVYDRYHRDLTA